MLSVGSQTLVRSLVRAGVLERVAQGLYVDARAPRNHVQRCWIGHLAAGDPSAIGGLAALHLAGVGGEPDVVEVVIPATRSVRLPAGYQQFRDRRDRVERARGLLPRIPWEDALLDACRGRPLDDFVALVSEAQRRRVTTIPRIARALSSRPREPRRPELLAVLGELEGIESVLEHRFARRVVGPHGLPRGVRQRAVGQYRVDVLLEGTGVVIELDGRQAHEGRRFRDLARDNHLSTLGMVTLRYGWLDVTERPCLVAAQIAATLRARGWGGRLRSCPACVLRRHDVDNHAPAGLSNAVPPCLVAVHTRLQAPGSPPTPDT